MKALLIALTALSFAPHAPAAEKYQPPRLELGKQKVQGHRMNRDGDGLAEASKYKVEETLPVDPEREVASEDGLKARDPSSNGAPVKKRPARKGAPKMEYWKIDK